MAQAPNNSPEIERLIRFSAACRICISDEAIALRQRFDVPARIGHSLRSHPAKWLGGILVLGFAGSMILRRKRQAPRQRRGWLGMLWSFASYAGRPIIKTWLTAQLKEFLMTQVRANCLAQLLAKDSCSTKLR
jgi:hypothetical protein